MTEMQPHQTEDWMKAVDESRLPGRNKAWIYQHGELPRHLWPLLVYDVPMLNGCIRRWLGVPKSLPSKGLYSTGSKLQLPLRPVTEEFKIKKVRQVMMLRYSADEKVSEAKVEDKTSRRWRADRAVTEAES